MNFDFNGEQFMLRDTVRDFLESRWSIHRLRSLVKRGADLDPELWDGLAELGYVGLLLPEEHGGAGMSLLDAVLIFEEFGRALITGPVSETMLAGEVIGRFGTAAQQEVILPGVAAGQVKLALAFHEPGMGYAAESVRLTAVPVEGGYRLTGQKHAVPYAHLADWLLVAARLGEGGPLALLLCDSRQEGVRVRQAQTMDPTFRLAEVTFEGALVPAARVLGEGPDRGALERLLETSAVAASAHMTGCAARTLDMAVAYAKERVQFGKPIGSFQAIKHKCADMVVAVETSRSAVYYAAWALAEGASERRLAVSMAKAYCSDAGRMVCNESLQIHGGIGFTWEHDIHFFLKRGKYLEYAFGDASWHRERVASIIAE